MSIEQSTRATTLEHPATTPPESAPDDRLAVKSLAHPYEDSRLALALAVSVFVFGIAAMVAISVGNPGAVVGAVFFIAVLAASIWLSLQILRAKLLGRAVRVTAGQLPALEGVLEEVRRRLDYRKPVDVYVIDQLDGAATLLSYLGTRIILLEGGLVADLQPAETRSQLVFLIGRFIGALKARHRPLVTVQLAIEAVDSLKFLNFFLAPYRRAIAYTGDQIGQACCGDLRATVAMMNRLLVGKELGPGLSVAGVLDQAAAVRRQILPRLAQLTMDEPHLTSRYLNVLCFAEKIQPDALAKFRAEQDAGVDARFGTLLAQSPHRRPIGHAGPAVRNWGVGGLTLGLLFIVGLALFNRGHASPVAANPTTTIQPSIAPTTPSAQPSASVSAAEVLAAHVPLAIRPNCREFVPDSLVKPGVDVAITCSLTTSGSPNHVNYYQYSASSYMSQAFYSLARSEPAADCVNTAGQATYMRAGSPAGVLACYRTASGTNVYLWTNNQLNVMAYAEDASMTFSNLNQWWQGAGPN
jgi:uncharacterized membrane protein